ncbi:MAG: flagellar hook-basal body complex protein FliE, partial [Bdellovibrionales bacterium]|nr:flagellar hook-basal body complex protein FliE [Bdellovibrionales bacterium]
MTKMKIGMSELSAGLRSIQEQNGGGIRPKSVDSGPAAGDRLSFGDFLKDQVQQINADANEADQLIQRAVTERDVNPHSAVIALQKADISFRLLMEVKERFV